MSTDLIERPLADATGAPEQDSVLSPLHVAIAAPTLNRPDGLRQLLEGLSRLTFKRVREPRITIIIVDNDLAPTAKAIVDTCRPLLRWPVIYHHEPRRGLVYARNAQLEAAPATADWLAMIDDDEVPVPEWLDALLAVGLAHGAQFVAGPVLPSFVQEPPRWAREGGFFEVGPLQDGAAIDFLYTGNVLMALEPVRAAGWRFEMAFNHSGGEDEQFFRHALRSGLKAVCAADAQVLETIPPSRATPRWVLRRYFRMGTTIAAMELMHDASLGVRVRRGLKGAARMLIGLVTMARAIATGSVDMVTGLSDVARGCGAIFGIFGMRYSEYRPGGQAR